MKHPPLRAALATLLLPTLAFAQAKPRPIPLGPHSVVQSHPNTLFNGWKLTPAGRHVAINSLPLRLLPTQDGQTLFALCAGRWDGIAVIDTTTEQATQWIPLPRAFNGLALSPDGKTLYTTGGNSDALYLFPFDGHKLSEDFKTIHLGDQPKESKKQNFLTGLTAHPTTGKLYVCNEGTSEVWVVNPTTDTVEARWPTPPHPYTCALGKDARFLFTSNWGDKSVTAFDLATGNPAVKINVGLRPNEMALAPDGRLFVACAGDNSVHVIQTTAPKDNDRDAQTNQHVPPPADALEILSTSLYPSSPEGSTPDAVAISPDGKSLFVANADNNDCLVADIADREATRVTGFVPTGWYPSALAATSTHLFVANGKGLRSSPSYPTTRPEDNVTSGIHFDPPLHILQGSVSIIDPPTPQQLADFTKQVRANSPYTPETLKLSKQPNDSIIPNKIGNNDDCPIKHVLYVIKENRTYDQVLGDMTDAAGKPIGNGSKDLAMFGQDVTPNQHQLARDFVLFDNFYANSEVSVDGHAWCDEAIATDFKQKLWITHYTGHGDLPGNAGTHATLAGSIWDACRRAGVSYLCYHEGSWAVPTANRGTWSEKGRDMDKIDLWIKDLHKFEHSDNPDAAFPQFTILWLGENHTHGTTPGAFTPQSCVASNDIAVGKLIDALSHSRFWKSTAVFIVEDDSQNGPDHVDAHRTVALAVSPWTRHHVVDSTHYTQMSILRTMELILAIPPLTQYDAAATPMFNAFAKTADQTPYTLQQPKVDLLAKNTPKSPGAQASAKMNFDEVDEAPEDELNRILWAATKGEHTPYPAPIHRALFPD